MLEVVLACSGCIVDIVRVLECIIEVVVVGGDIILTKLLCARLLVVEEGCKKAFVLHFMFVMAHNNASAVGRFDDRIII